MYCLDAYANLFLVSVRIADNDKLSLALGNPVLPVYASVNTPLSLYNSLSLSKHLALRFPRVVPTFAVSTPAKSAGSTDTHVCEATNPPVALASTAPAPLISCDIATVCCAN